MQNVTESFTQNDSGEGNKSLLLVPASVILVVAVSSILFLFIHNLNAHSDVKD